MNYRHLYHAGGFADIFKHIVLMLVLEYIQQKDKPCFYLDTHAGIGLYDLQSEEALKTGESATGIGILRERKDQPEDIRRFLDIAARAVRRHGNLSRYYPGSPLILRELLRPNDRLTANELHPEDFKTLKRHMGRDPRLKVENADGYGLLKALLPPPERRGIVLIDPPFEVTDEFARMAKGMDEALRRWATGVYILWYPVKEIKEVRRFQDGFRQMELVEKAVAVDFLLQEPAHPDRLNGCGVVIINPPWTLAGRAKVLLPWLTDALTSGRGSFQIRHLVENN